MRGRWKWSSMNAQERTKAAARLMFEHIGYTPFGPRFLEHFDSFETFTPWQVSMIMAGLMLHLKAEQDQETAKRLIYRALDYEEEW